MKKVKQFVPVMAPSLSRFTQWVAREVERTPKKDWSQVTESEVQIKDTLYMYASSVQRITGYRYKKFVDLDACGFHPQRKEILELVLHEAQSKRGK